MTPVEIYMMEIPPMCPDLTVPVAGAVLVDTRSPERIAPMHPSDVRPWSARMTVIDDVPQVEQVLPQAELVQDLPSVAQPQAYGTSRVQGISVSLGGNESSLTLVGSAESKGITGNQGTTVAIKRAFGGARGVPPRGRPV